MTGNKTTNLSEAIRNLIVCDTQFGWNGETTLKLPELLDLQARGWLIEGDENNEFSLTVGGEAVVARALQLAAPAELAEQQGVSLPPLPRTHYNACGDGSEPLYTAEQMDDYARAALAATGKQQVGEPEIEFQARLMDVKTDLPTENWRHSPTYDENPGRGTHYWVQFRKRYIYYTPPAQGIDLAQPAPSVTRYRIEDAPGLDPVTVYVENYEPGKGRMVVTCYASAWTAFWGAMGEDTTLEQFVASCSPDYVADNMVWGADTMKSTRGHADKVAAAVVALFKSQRDAAPGEGS